MKKISVKGLMTKLDKLVREIVFLRDGRCVTCPLWKEIKPAHQGSYVMQPGHYITRGAKSVRWDLRNVYQTCRTCNYLHEIRPSVLADYVISVLDVAGHEDLVREGNRPMPSIKKWQLEEIQENLLKELAKYK